MAPGHQQLLNLRAQVIGPGIAAVVVLRRQQQLELKIVARPLLVEIEVDTRQDGAVGEDGATGGNARRSLQRPPLERECGILFRQGVEVGAIGLPQGSGLV
jgi:hypothetical protein